jgi:hypothetical protein
MKKLLLIIMLIASFVTLKAQDTTVFAKISTESNKALTAVDTNSNFKMVYSDIKSGISALASSLKVGSEHVYKILVKQAIVEAIQGLIILLISIFILLNGYKALRSDEKWETKETYSIYPSLNSLGLFRIFQLIAGLILFIAGMFFLNIIITGFVNPEYAAINKILEIIKR